MCFFCFGMEGRMLFRLLTVRKVFHFSGKAFINQLPGYRSMESTWRWSFALGVGA